MAIDTLYVKPKILGATVRNPLNGHRIADSGISVPANAFWLRRLKDGDVVETDRPAPKINVKVGE